MRVIIVGAGITGTAHAWMAVERGHDVVHLDRELEARGRDGPQLRSGVGVGPVGARTGDHAAVARALGGDRGHWSRLSDFVPMGRSHCCATLPKWQSQRRSSPVRMPTAAAFASSREPRSPRSTRPFKANILPD